MDENKYDLYVQDEGSSTYWYEGSAQVPLSTTSWSNIARDLVAILGYNPRPGQILLLRYSEADHHGGIGLVRVVSQSITFEEV